MNMEVHYQFTAKDKTLVVSEGDSAVVYATMNIKAFANQYEAESYAKMFANAERLLAELKALTLSVQSNPDELGPAHPDVVRAQKLINDINIL